MIPNIVINCNALASLFISKSDPLKSGLEATVVKVGAHYIDVAFSINPPKWALKQKVRIDLYVNDIAFKRMKHNLQKLAHATGAQRRLRDIILGIHAAAPQKTNQAHKTFIPRNRRLNDIQKSAVADALANESIMLIHGPPGTGKTTLIASLIAELDSSQVHVGVVTNVQLHT
ncbi:MAG: AAA family ATPase, partial [Kangiellaceae bacterium]|nr:AAA family ATPase [Kangiellaceae bacterium]